jgi:hypothetical protein
MVCHRVLEQYQFLSGEDLIFGVWERVESFIVERLDLSMESRCIISDTCEVKWCINVPKQRSI